MSITYSQVGDDYNRKDPIKKIAQIGAALTGGNLGQHGFSEYTHSRGESAYVWKQGDIHMASTVEGLGTKNMVADAMRKITGRTYYDIIGYETVATVVNDLITVGAKPLVTHAYWAVGSNEWFEDEPRMMDLVRGWHEGCDAAGTSWGGGESPTLTTVVHPDHIDLGGSSVGIIEHESHLLSDTRLKTGDRIIMLKSTGINANGISLARAVADRLPAGYGTRLTNGLYYGEAVLNKTNIYARLLKELFAGDVELHYVSNITGHGQRKVMRARGTFTYVLERIFEPQPVFDFIQKNAELNDYQMYETYNMGMDFALFLPQDNINKALEIIKKSGFDGMDAGYVTNGQRQVIIEPKNITFRGETMNLR